MFSKEKLIIGSPFCDLPSYFYPSRLFGFNLFKKGIIPLWCPNLKAGFPFIGTLQSAIFYPANLLFLILSIRNAFNICYLFHLSISGIFTYLFIKHITGSRMAGIVSGIIYIFSSFQILHIFSGNINIICAMAWTPLVFLLIDRALKEDRSRWIIIAGIIFGMQILAGYIQYIFHLGIFISLYLLIVRIKSNILRRLWFILLLLIVGFGVSAIQILPTLELSINSVRAKMPYEFCGTFSLPPENFTTLLFPDFFGNDITVPYFGRCHVWETCIYVGIVTLILTSIAIIYNRGIYKRTFFILAILSIILSLGRFTPLFKILYNYIPGFNLFRGNSKFFAFTTLFIAVLSGLGTTVLTMEFERLKNKKILLNILLVIFFTLPIIYIIINIVKNYEVSYRLWLRILEKIYILDEKYQPLPPLSGLEFFTRSFLLVYENIEKAISIAVLFIGVLVLRLKDKITKTGFNIFLLIILVGDLWLFGSKFAMGFNQKTCHWDVDIKRFLAQNNTEPFRINYFDQIWNKGMADNLQIIGGYEHSTLRRYSELINLNNNLPINTPQIFTVINNTSILMDLLNVKYYIVPQGLIVDAPNLKLVYSNKDVDIYENTKVLPRVFIVHKVKILKDRGEIFKELLNPEFNPKEVVILEEPPEIGIQEGTGRDEVNILSYTPNKISISASLETNGILILGDNFYPGWDVYVDTKKDEILISDYSLRGVALEKGTHEIEFIYRPKSFIFGLIISPITSITLIIYFLIRRR